MRGDEARVVAQFVDWMERAGWTVELETAYCDIVAKRSGETLYAEAKGRTAAIGLDVDTLYGQLLRRVPPTADPAVRLGVVVPAEARSAALRVPTHIRAALRVTVYVVDEFGAVEVIHPMA